MGTLSPLLNNNGYIVVEDDRAVAEVGYRGVYGIVWPLISLPAVRDRQLEDALEIDRYSGKTARAEVSVNWQAVLQYWKYCRSNNLSVRLLRIETELAQPTTELPNNTNWEFLGYDISYITGDFYSAIHQDLLVRTVDELQGWKGKLNQNRLFDDFQSASDFLSARALLDGSKIETVGDFFVVRLFNYIPSA